MRIKPLNSDKPAEGTQIIDLDDPQPPPKPALFLAEGHSLRSIISLFSNILILYVFIKMWIR